MKTIMKNYLLLIIIVLGSNIYAQKEKVKSGTVDFLKGQSKMKVIFDYSNLKINADSITEAEYVQKKIVDLNGKNAGNGDIWNDKWTGAKESIWEPKFMELLTKYGAKSTGISFSENATDAPYTMIVKVDWIYPGWDAFVMKQAAKVSTTITIVDSNNFEDKKFVINYKEAPGTQFGNNYSDESRIGEGFAKTAKTFSKMLEKKIK
ncbi:hypothetical protein FH779_16885 [Empedobacter falsenii]|uniref:Uncharacterized protein n=4 Tax=Weeksellaceae TaxID=2762318 RepID=A0A7H9DX60_9FLAO|nr:hypothetical protein FH779_16885 [Empedobacter falsenii]